MRRRAFLATPLAALAPGAFAQEPYPRVTPGRRLDFPSDHGAHPLYRNEWWYVTGWLRGEGGRELGFQVTFFRNRPNIAEDLSSRFAPKQLLFAHAALADPKLGRLLHDQRAAREGFDVAAFATHDTAVRIGHWSLARGEKGYAARVASAELDLLLDFAPTQPLLLQGDGGVSRKGPRTQQASFYYSRPHLAATGSVAAKGRSMKVEGRAWLDHEWSSEVLASDAVGWDWVGLNGEDGSAFMAFQIRSKAGNSFWAGGSRRSADGKLRVFRPEEVRFEPLRRWKSPRSGVVYPVSMKVTAADTELVLVPLMDDQELDARASTATIYWEGAVKASSGGSDYGRGYLELTGYWQPMKL